MNARLLKQEHFRKTVNISFPSVLTIQKFPESLPQSGILDLRSMTIEEVYQALDNEVIEYNTKSRCNGSNGFHCC